MGGLFGKGEVGLRSLSAVLGTATIPVVYAAARSLSSRPAALVAAAVTAANPMLIWYSQEARNYALLIFLAALSFLFFVWVIQGRDARWLWGWAAASALALATRYFALALILPEAAWLLWHRRDALSTVALSIGAVGVAGVALLPLATSQRGNADWIALTPLDERMLRVPQHLLVGMSVPWTILSGIVIGALGAVLVYALWRAEPSARRAAAVGGWRRRHRRPDRPRWRIRLPDLPQHARAVDPARRRAGGGAGSGKGGMDRTAERGRPVRRRPCPRRVDGGYARGSASGLERARSQTRSNAAGAVRRLAVRHQHPPGQVLDGGRYADPNESFTASELAVVKPRPIRDYALGTCWWVALCGGHDLFGDAARFDVPAEFDLVEEGTTAQYDYRLYRAPEPVVVDPPTVGLTVRLFAQPPA
jgi:hypothetical protein